MSDKTSTDAETESSGFSDVDEYVVAVTGEFNVPSSIVGDSENAKEHVLNKIDADDRDAFEATIVDVTGVNDELAVNFIKRFGDAGEDLNAANTEWVLEKTSVLGWVPPEETTPGGKPLSEFRSTTSIQHGEMKESKKTHINDNETVYRISGNNDEVIKHVSTKYITLLTDLFDATSNELINQSFVGEDTPFILIKPPASGWIAVGTIQDLHEDKYIWTTISLNGELT